MANKADPALLEVIRPSDLPSKHSRTQLTKSSKQKLKSSLWFSIGKIADEETARLHTTATPQFIGALTEMVWSQIGSSPPSPRLFASYPAADDGG